MRRGSRVKKKGKWNDRGALEGLPLYLIIMVVIAAIAIAIIVAWLLLIPKPLSYIKIDNKDLTVGTSENVCVTAYNTADTKMVGVTVELNGAGYAHANTTDNNGEACFSFTPTIENPDTNYAIIEVKATKDAVIKIDKITVNR